jgi:hypothetical protein
MKKTDLYNSRIKYAKASTAKEKIEALRELRQAVNELIDNLFDALSSLIEAMKPLAKNFNQGNTKSKWLQDYYETG